MKKSIEVSEDFLVIIGGSDCTAKGFGTIIAMIDSLDDIYPKKSEIVIRRDITCSDIPSNAYMVMSKDYTATTTEDDDDDDEACSTRVFQLTDDDDDDDNEEREI